MAPQAAPRSPGHPVPAAVPDAGQLPAQAETNQPRGVLQQRAGEKELERSRLGMAQQCRLEAASRQPGWPTVVKPELVQQEPVAQQPPLGGLPSGQPAGPSGGHRPAAPIPRGHRQRQDPLLGMLMQALHWPLGPPQERAQLEQQEPGRALARAPQGHREWGQQQAGNQLHRSPVLEPRAERNDAGTSQKPSKLPGWKTRIRPLRKGRQPHPASDAARH